ncbi:MAG: CHAD domain-containing protein [Burkholderiaceae bacterium]|nr:CHAD domain-containing protein [Burkholderiaceae bacterium]
MASETELKLALAPRDLPALLAHPLLAGMASRRVRLRNTYFDTPKRALLERRVAVRERQLGRQTLLTVKTAGTVIGGLARRGEWEAPTTPGQFDFAALIGDDAGLAGELQALAGELVPVFSTDFGRRIWLLEHRGARIEVALDQGRIRTGEGNAGAPPRHRPILELELELQSGPVDALFQLARQLAKAAPLQPMHASKAERGYNLFLDRPTPPVKAAAVRLSASDSPEQAFQAVALRCLAQLQANTAGVIDSDDPEYLHQARVALRRLRAALQLFAPVLPPRLVERWSRNWRSLGQSLGAARDLDVFAGSLLPELTGSLSARDTARLQRWARARSTAARADARSGLQSARHADHLLTFTQAVLKLAPMHPASGTAADAANHDAVAGSGKQSRKPSRASPTLKRWAREQLQEREQRLFRRVRRTEMVDDDGRHRVRIEAKKLRYGLDFFASLWPHERLHGYGQSLAAAQDLLGRMNDRVSARRLLTTQPAAPLAAAVLQLLSARLSAQQAHDAAQLPDTLSALHKARAPWRKGSAKGKGGRPFKKQKK